MKRTKRKSKVSFAGVLIFALGLTLIFYPHVAQYVNNLSASIMVKNYLEGSEIGAPSFTDAEITQTSVAEGGFTLEDDMFGSIFIPKLNLELPIYVGSTTANLSRGISHLEGSSLPIGGESTHSVLCGHNGNITNEWFTHIDQLSNGDLFYIKTREQELTYRVYDSKIISPTDTSDLYIQDGRDIVTLLTCANYGKMRLIVSGERLS